MSLAVNRGGVNSISRSKVSQEKENGGVEVLPTPTSSVTLLAADLRDELPGSRFGKRHTSECYR
jgi:hypothetical protein